MNKTMRVGVSSWQQFASEGGFYPDDIPDEWRLGYFANEFSTACIDLDAFVQDDVEWEEMFEDLAPDFSLSFLVKSRLALELLQRLIDQQAVHCDYVLAGSELPLNEYFFDRPVIDETRLWMPDQPSTDSSIALLPAGESLKQYRLWIEQWISNCGPSDHPLTLWGNGKEWKYSALNEVKTLVELMGY